VKVNPYLKVSNFETKFLAKFGLRVKVHVGYSMGHIAKPDQKVFEIRSRNFRKSSSELNLDGAATVGEAEDRIKDAFGFLCKILDESGSPAGGSASLEDLRTGTALESKDEDQNTESPEDTRTDDSPIAKALDSNDLQGLADLLDDWQPLETEDGDGPPSFEIALGAWALEALESEEDYVELAGGRVEAQRGKSHDGWQDVWLNIDAVPSIRIIIDADKAPATEALMWSWLSGLFEHWLVFTRDTLSDHFQVQSLIEWIAECHPPKHAADVQRGRRRVAPVTLDEAIKAAWADDLDGLDGMLSSVPDAIIDARPPAAEVLCGWAVDFLDWQGDEDTSEFALPGVEIEEEKLDGDDDGGSRMVNISILGKPGIPVMVDEVDGQLRADAAYTREQMEMDHDMVAPDGWTPDRFDRLIRLLDAEFTAGGPWRLSTRL
jgi:hypothetical protein